MPASKKTTAPRALKRTRVSSTRKREADKNAEAKQHERTTKKASTKARKAQRKEAADDDVLVGYDGESCRSQKLCARTTLLESENQRLKAKIKRREELKKGLPVKLIPEPTSKIDSTIDGLCADMGMAGDEHDVEWLFIRAAFRALIGAVGLDWEKTWSKQDIGKINTLIQAAKGKYPQFKCFENHWGLRLLLQECFGNIHSYKQKLAWLSPRNDDNTNEDTGGPNLTLNNPTTRPIKRRRLNNTADAQDSDDAETASTNMAKAKLAAHLSLDHSGDTELEDLPDDVCRIVEREEIGVPATPKLPAKTVGKLKQASKQGQNGSSPSASSSKPRAIIYMRRGRGGKVVMGRGQNTGCGSVAVDESDASSKVSDNDISDSSGQTTSNNEED